MSRITALLGPTNTGKTHYAVERMLNHRSGVIGLPLRLLAREVYDRIVRARGPSVAALVTGEERIIGARAQYWVATTEAMPEVGADFLAVDEIQLCADPERGHVFTDRLLHARGRVETMFLGAETIRPAIAALVPEAQFSRRERFSALTWAGVRKLSRMPARSAIVGFSVEQVYATAELVRRMKGGCAVVMGALSPRTRNAQVALYQSGEVDFLVATDAIGMGLNLDIGHVAFESTRKFDGRRMRDLFPHELAQIAGRAGRHTQPGTFGTTGEAGALDPGLIEAIENHRFAPIQRLVWRNAALDFGTLDRLIASLEAPPPSPWLAHGREADDLIALKSLAERPDIRRRVTTPRDVRLLWDICRVPDFRGHSTAEHVSLLERLFGFLQHGTVPGDWLAKAVSRIDRTDGGIDVLSKRLAYIRTWTYVAQRNGWVADEAHWRDETRAVEDRLSDALHAALTQRFVDRRTSVLMRRLKQKEGLVAEVNDKGEVTVEGEFAGRLEGFRFHADKAASQDEARMLTRAGHEALRPEFHLRADRFYNAPDTELDFTEQGGLMWGDAAIGKLVKGADPLKPGVEVFVDEEAGEEVIEKVRRRAGHFIDRKLATLFEPLLKLRDDETLTGLARGFAFQMVEGFGILPRAQVADAVRDLDQEARGLLRKHGVRFGQYTIFQPALLKPAPTRLRLLLWSLVNGLDEFPSNPPPGLVTIPNDLRTPRAHVTLSGYFPAGERAIRIDMLERLADMLRGQDSRAGFEATADMLSITGMTLEQFSALMEGLGYHAERGERSRQKPEAAEPARPEAVTEEATTSEVGAEAPEPEAAAVPEAASEAVAEAGEAAVEAPAESTEPAPEIAAKAREAVAAEAPAQGTEPPAGTETAVAPAPADVPESAAEAVADPVQELEVFYTFTWSPRPRGGQRPRGGKPQHGQRRAEDGEPAQAEGARPPRKEFRHRDKDAGHKDGERKDRPPRKDRKFDGERGDKRGGKPPREDKPRSFSARPPKADKPIDPDNPFAVLAALKRPQ